MNTLYNLLASGSTTAGIGEFLSSFQETLANYGSIVSSIIGIAMVVVAIYQIAKGLMSGGKGQTNWVMTIALLLIGGALALVGGWGTVGNFVNIGDKTITEMSQGNADTDGDKVNPFEQKVS